MAITTRNYVLQNRAKGLGWQTPFMGTSNGGNLTSAGATSGFLTVSLKPNAIGSTLPNTIRSFPAPPATSGDYYLHTITAASGATLVKSWLCWIYEIGTQVLTSTGDQFTHHAATFPILRTVMGQASSPITLTPMYQVTTATATTAAVLTIKTAAGGTGYVDQDGNNVVGSRTFTMPAVGTTTNSCYFPVLEEGDSGVRNIAAIQTNTSATAGAVRVWGVEFLAEIPGTVAGVSYAGDSMLRGINAANLTPGVATSGTANSKLVIISINTNASGINPLGSYSAVKDV